MQLQDILDHVDLTSNSILEFPFKSRLPTVDDIRRVFLIDKLSMTLTGFTDDNFYFLNTNELSTAKHGILLPSNEDLTLDIVESFIKSPSPKTYSTVYGRYHGLRIITLTVLGWPITLSKTLL